MTKRDDLELEDQQLFRQHVGSVKRLNCDRLEPPRGNGPVPIPYFTRCDERQVIQELISGHFEPIDVETGEEIQYCREGLQQSVLRKLKRGQFRVGAALDLHGMSVITARQALTAFLRTARRNDMTCVRIIHGKGKRSRHKGPVLKQKVNHWLRQREEVLAFCSARPVDGGTGAVYVLLRHRR
jgi:DNA-nicking Smr family endonuclease